MIHGEIITEGEMKQAREQAQALQPIIDQNPALEASLGEAQQFLLKLGYKGMA